MQKKWNEKKIKNNIYIYIYMDKVWGMPLHYKAITLAPMQLMHI